MSGEYLMAKYHENKKIVIMINMAIKCPENKKMLTKYQVAQDCRKYYEI